MMRMSVNALEYWVVNMVTADLEDVYTRCDDT